QRQAAERRPAFTLLEVVLAMSISILLLAGLYAALNIQVHHSQAAREVVEQTVLARSLVSRISRDLAPALAPPAPLRTQAPSGSGGGGASTQTTTSSSPTTPATPGGSTTPATTDPAAGATANPNAAAITVRVEGNSTVLSLYVTRVPRELNPLTLQMGLP